MADPADIDGAEADRFNTPAGTSRDDAAFWSEVAKIPP
jgi:hypothetical protein